MNGPHNYDAAAIQQQQATLVPWLCGPLVLAKITTVLNECEYTGSGKQSLPEEFCSCLPRDA